MREHYASVGATGAVQIEGGAPSTSQAALPAGWEGCLDPASNRVFYHHAATRTSQWNSPLGGRSARVVRPPREPYPQTFDSEEPDLLVLSQHSSNALLVNQGDCRFEDGTEEAGLTGSSRSVHASWVDRVELQECAIGSNCVSGAIKVVGRIR